MEVLEKVSLGELMRKPVSSLNPKDHQKEIFNYYSIPAYDEGDPIKELGKEIGSSKKVLEKGDILISRIVPHIQRVWIVDENGSHTNIGSSEWIVFNTDKVLPEYLRYFLLSDVFHNQFMQTITGVGGSLMRANKKQTEKIKIPVCPIDQQKEIVAKLDRAQRLIDIDRQMLAKYDELIQSVFLEMFGDPRSNTKKIKTGKLGDYAFINMGQSPKGTSYNEEGEGEPLLNGPTEFGEKYPKEKQWTTEPKKFAEVDDILFCVRGATAGRTNLADKKYCIGRGLAAVRGEEKLDTTFIHFVLKSHYDYFQNQGQGSTFINIAKKDLSNLKVPIPSKELQNKFVSASKEIENQKQVTKGSLKKSEELFSSVVEGVFS